MRLKRGLFAFMIFILIGCQDKLVVFFEDIYIGDNLETCLAKGNVQYKSYNTSLELVNTHIINYFTDSEVKFSKKNIVKEINLTFQPNQPNKGMKDAKEVFNFMTQYFCQRYSNMKTEVIDEEQFYDRYEIKSYLSGKKIIWETNNIIVTLKFYYNNPDYTPIPRMGDEVCFDWTGDFAEDIKGEWVELIILAK